MAFLNADSEVPTKGKGAKLTPKMANFVKEYQTDWNAKQSVLRAGYKTRNPSRMAEQLLQHPLIKAELAKDVQARHEKLEIKADYLLHKLVRIIEATEEDNPTAALRAIELAGKSIALWKERTEITGADGDAIRVQEQKIEQNVTAFKSRIAGIATRGGAERVSEFPKPSGDS